MCGFTGFIDFKGNLIDYEKILKQSSNLINFRGPDEGKNLILNELGIYLKRITANVFIFTRFPNII